MSNIYSEKGGKSHTSGRLEKFANEIFDILKDFHSDREQSRTKVFGKHNKFRVSRKDKT